MLWWEEEGEEGDAVAALGSWQWISWPQRQRLLCWRRQGWSRVGRSGWDQLSSGCQKAPVVSRGNGLG